MGLLDIFGSDMLKEKALGFLKKTMKDGNLKFVIVSIKDDDTFDFQFLKHEDQPVIYSQAVIDKMQNAYLEIRESHNLLMAENERLASQYESALDSAGGQEAVLIVTTEERDKLLAICKEQEAALLKYQGFKRVGDNILPIINPENPAHEPDPAVGE